MCHSSPTAQILGSLVTIAGSCFIAWHIYCFDKGRCLLYKRQDAFRWIIMWMLICSLVMFVTWNFILTWVKYTEYYAVIPLSTTTTEITPVPYQLWPTYKQNLVRADYHILSVAWALLLSIHAEETLYWAYLIGAIRSRNARSWLKSIHFKVWVLCCITVFAVLLGAAQIETQVLTKMEANIFMAGSIFAAILFLTSLWLFAVFPGFIAESRRQGANPEVIGRLQYFKELNTIRTFFRFIYAFCLLALSCDSFTKATKLNTTPYILFPLEKTQANSSRFALDALYTVGFFCVFTSTAISLMILLPRSMTSEAGVPKQANVFVQQHHPYQPQSSRTHKSVLPSNRDVPTADRYSTPWGILGERLNLEKTIIDEMESQENSFDLPFAAQPGSRRLEDQEAYPGAPRALKNFTSPLDINQPQGPIDLNIVVMTQTLVEKDS
ncbi:hypothetical protein P7C73_g89, partial [Tremellales sp. Uapishka_1]